MQKKIPKNVNLLKFKLGTTKQNGCVFCFLNEESKVNKSLHSSTTLHTVCTFKNFLKSESYAIQKKKKNQYLNGYIVLLIIILKLCEQKILFFFFCVG